MQIAFN